MSAKVAMAFVGPNITEASELHQALQTARFELNYERSSRIIEGVAKDEDIRKLRFRIATMEDDIEDLNEQLAKEEERADCIAQDLEDAMAQTSHLDATVQQLTNELRIKTRELETAEAEVSVMNGFSNDSAKVLREKLALTRELANLKPEVEHLRSQVASNQDLLSEKLSLQRQLNTLQVELENAKRTAERAFAKSGKSGEQSAEDEAQIEQLQKQLREAKQSTQESVKEIESLKSDLVTAKKSAAKTSTKQNSSGEAESKLKLEIEELRRELATEKKERQRVEKALTKDDLAGKADDKLKIQLEELRKELATEKKERQRVEKATEKEQAASEAQRASLEDKLATFRAKLKSTKDKFKEKEAELQRVEEAAAANPEQNVKAKNPRKRQVAQMDPDAAIGTPGDAVPAKRGKRGFSTAPGDKSTFSITPFLNRTMSLIPDGPESDKEEQEEEKEDTPAPESEAEFETEGTPTVASKKASKKEKAPSKPKLKPLAPASSEKQNSKPKSKRPKAAVPILEKVTEEEENIPSHKEAPQPMETSDKEQEPAYKESTTTTKVPLVPKKTASMKQKPRKSLMSFATFTDEPAPEKKKKRKLLANASGLGKTLFDEDDGDKLPAKPVPGRGLFAARGLIKGGVFGAKKGLKPLIMADDGFQFSPLKKDRKAMALAQSMIGD